MEAYDLSAIEAKYPLATFSADLFKNSDDVQYAELAATVTGQRGHVTQIQAPDGLTVDVLDRLARGIAVWYKTKGIDLTGKTPEEA